MNLNEYQKRVEDTWISNIYNVSRCFLGIFGEAGECAELFKKLLRGDNSEIIISPRFVEKVRKELGDLSYYIAKLCNELKIGWCINTNRHKLYAV